MLRCRPPSRRRTASPLWNLTSFAQLEFERSCRRSASSSSASWPMYSLVSGGRDRAGCPTRWPPWITPMRDIVEVRVDAFWCLFVRHAQRVVLFARPGRRCGAQREGGGPRRRSRGRAMRCKVRTARTTGTARQSAILAPIWTTNGCGEMPVLRVPILLLRAPRPSALQAVRHGECPKALYPDYGIE